MTRGGSVSEGTPGGSAFRIKKFFMRYLPYFLFGNEVSLLGMGTDSAFSCI